MMQEFLSRCREAAERLRKEERITVFGHRDADGICASVIVKMFLSEKDVKISIIRHSTDFERISSQNGDSFPVFVDYGSSEIKNIERFFDDFLILDHHPAAAFHPKMVNPWEYGIDGTRDLSGAGVTYFVAREGDHANVSLSGIALIGAMGDKVHLSGFGGPSRLILEDAKASGALRSIDGPDSLQLKGLPFDEGAQSALEMADILDSCASMNRPELAVDMMLGDKGAYSAARDLHRDYQDRFNCQLGAIMANRCVWEQESSQHLANFIFLDIIEPGFTGALAEKVISPASSKPVVILSRAPYGLKASSRATREQVDGGLDLGRAMSHAADACKGKGGGHNIAAGASFDEAYLEFFKTRMTLELFRQSNSRLKALLEVEAAGEAEARSLSSSLAVDNECFRTTSSFAMSCDNKLYIMVLSEDIGTFKNTVDDMIVCLSSCKDVVSISGNGTE